MALSTVHSTMYLQQFALFIHIRAVFQPHPAQSLGLNAGFGLSATPCSLGFRLGLSLPATRYTVTKPQLL